jgi:hypothetical protein
LGISMVLAFMVWHGILAMGIGYGAYDNMSMIAPFNKSGTIQ